MQRLRQEDVTAAARTYAGGSIFGGGKVLRKGRWGCPPRHCPYDIFPTRYAGGQYMLGNDAVRVVTRDALRGLLPWRGDPYPIEDHYIASHLHAAGIDVERERRLWWKGGQPYFPPWVTEHGGLHFLEHRP